MRKFFGVIFIFVLFLAGPSNSLGQSTTHVSDLLTAAERTEYEETTSYAEVMSFIHTATDASPNLHLSSFGYSLEGRELPLVIFGNVKDATTESILNSGKLRVFIQANIHAGEVCGKEALLAMIRDMAQGKYAELLDDMVVIMAPIYNADGNERVNLFNRPRQNGPIGGMGQRPNAQGLDLNRDHMKVKSPEARSLIRLFNEYDPHVVVDLHTTNGTRHAYHITYSTPLNPNTDQGIDSFLRDVWMKDVTNTIRNKVGWEYYYYGNLPFRAGDAAWYTFDHRPRFNNNYVGLRNRMAILSEGYAYATFEERILATRYFVEEILAFASSHRTQIEQLVSSADQFKLTGTELGVRFEPKMNSESTEILMGAVDVLTNPYSGATYFERKDTVYTQVMPEYGAFQATETSRVPANYYVSAAAASLVGAYLDTHGISYSVLKSKRNQDVESFTIASSEAAENEFQQIKERTLTGAYAKQNVELEAGSLQISSDQPLARLAFYLLEPRSDDGLVNWAQMDKWSAVGSIYPIYRSLE
ncbi:M14 family metallopeptidase [bacterium]|nr:M14 family metallopeptidase [bacterium]